MRIAYITAHAPFGRGETFILNEMVALTDLGIDLIIIPRSPSKEIFHAAAYQLADKAIRLPLMNWQIFFSFLKTLFSNSRLFKIIGVMMRNSRLGKTIIKNLSVLPKAVFVASILKEKQVRHIHAHWGSTTATMAWIISEFTNIPWSFTLHRWDIAENNMLKLKVEKATFVRCISEDGRREALNIVGTEHQDKVKVLHMGVKVQDAPLLQTHQSRSSFVIACPANFVPTKGHRFLIEACSLLLNQGMTNLCCLLIGDGPLEREIRRQIEEFHLEENVKLVGRLPHNDLMRMYEHGQVDVVVLPSIETADKEKEGIPVALMEAMAFGIPVISTATGGIPELLHNGAGVLVPPASSKALAEAILRLMNDQALRTMVRNRGFERISQEFNLQSNAQRLLALMTSES